MGAQATHGILYPGRSERGFTLGRWAPSEALAPFVARYWIVRWDLGEETFTQEILPHPTTNLAFEARGSAFHGPATKRFVARLEGKGRVVGVKFRPAGLTAFGAPKMTALFASVLPVGALFGEEGDALAARVLADDDDAAVRAAIDGFLRELRPRHDLRAVRTSKLVERIQADRAIARAEDVARIAGLSLRSLHRYFERYVGVGPKWIVRRARVHEAAERVAAGEAVDWAALSLDLGYHDQAHLIHDFKEQIGETPAAYAEACRRAFRPVRVAV